MMLTEFTKSDLALIGRSLELQKQQLQRRIRASSDYPGIACVYKDELTYCEEVIARCKLIEANQQELPI